MYRRLHMPERVSICHRFRGSHYYRARTTSDVSVCIRTCPVYIMTRDGHAKVLSDWMISPCHFFLPDSPLPGHRNINRTSLAPIHWCLSPKFSRSFWGSLKAFKSEKASLSPVLLHFEEDDRWSTSGGAGASFRHLIRLPSLVWPTRYLYTYSSPPFPSTPLLPSSLQWQKLFQQIRPWRNIARANILNKSDSLRSSHLPLSHSF